MISRKDISVSGPFQNYVDKAGDDDLTTALAESTRRAKKLFKRISRKKVDYAYAEGKWTIKQLLQHIIDAERVFVLRAVWFTRRDPSPQPGFEENVWAENADVNNRKWKDMLEEFFALRYANQLFFDSLNDEALSREGVSGGRTLSTATLGFVSAGHLNHHLDIIEERYLAKNKKAGKVSKATKADRQMENA